MTRINKLSLFLILLSSSLMFSIQRNLSIFLDYAQEETIQETLTYGTQSGRPVGLGAMTYAFLIALEDKSTPLLVHRSLIQTVLDHKKFFQDFATLPLPQLQKLYGSAPRFSKKGSLASFKKLCTYMHTSLNTIKEIYGQHPQDRDPRDPVSILNKDPHLQDKQAPAELRSEAEDRTPIFEMIIYSLCYQTSFDDYHMKKVSQDLILLIPDTFLKHNHIKKELLAQTPKAHDPLTPLEKEWGLRINHLQDIKVNGITHIADTQPFIPALKKLFVTYAQEKNQIKQWHIYLAGHGLARNMYFLHIDQLQALKQHINTQLKKPEFKACITADIHKNTAHASNCPCHEKYTVLINQREAIERQLTAVHTTLQQYPDHPQGVIASLSPEIFQQFLGFLNDHIPTKFLYYSSCFAGGLLSVTPFMKQGKPVRYNYTIVSGTVAEVPAQQEIPTIAVPPYSDNNPLLEDDIDATGHFIYSTAISFKQFFAGLEQGLPTTDRQWDKLINTLHRYTDSDGTLSPLRLCNIPLIRAQGADKFTTLKQTMPFISVTQELLNSSSVSKTLKLDKECLLLYAPHIKHTVSLLPTITGSIPLSVSLIPGIAMHTFESILAADFTFDEICHSFLHLDELAETKIFWIKNLQCIQAGKLRTIHDVVIMRNSMSRKKDTLALTNEIYYTDEHKKCHCLSWAHDTLAVAQAHTRIASEDEYLPQLLAFADLPYTATAA